jgi:hypothetical protein
MNFTRTTIKVRETNERLYNESARGIPFLVCEVALCSGSGGLNNKNEIDVFQRRSHHPE